MTDLATLTRRLRRYIGDNPYGVSYSGGSPSTNLSASGNNQFQISIGGSSPQVVDLGTAALLLNGHIIATKIQDAVRALDPTNVLYNNFTAMYVYDNFVLKTGAPSSEGRIVITNAVSNNAAAELKLGIYNGGMEYFDPVPRYTDTELSYFLGEGLASYNEKAETTNTYDQLTSHESLLVLHHGWLNALEAIAGESVYTYKETIGRDTLDLSTIFKNIIELMKYLRKRITELEEESGLGSFYVVDLVRHDPLYGGRLPEYSATDVPSPKIVNLAKVDDTTLLIEWDEIHDQEFASITVYTNTVAGNMLDKSLITEESSSNKSGVIEAAVSQRTIYNGYNTVVSVKDLPTTAINVLLVVTTRRQRYVYSDQYSIDLAAATPTATLEYEND